MTSFTCTDHDWKPLFGWSGRYRCSRRWCSVIGYKGIVTAEIGDPLEHGGGSSAAWQSKPQHIARIIPYLCRHSVGILGEAGSTTCGNPVVQFKSEEDAKRTRKPRCADHRR